MASGWGDSAGGASDTGPGGDPDPEEFELVVELVEEPTEYGAYGDFHEAPLIGEGPNTATSDRETIGGSADGASPLRRLPRPLRIAGVLAAATALALAVWPASGRREAAPRPLPTPSQVNVDLYKVRLGATSLQAVDGADHAVLGLSLTNNAATRLEVVSAEVWDAAGTRIGSASMWPAEGLAAKSTQSVPVTLPYECGGFGFLPVLPLMIQYSISTPQDPAVRHDYAYPLADTLWDSFMHGREAQCAGTDNAVNATAIDTTQPIGAPADPQGFDLTVTLEAAGTAKWSLDKVTATDPALTITGTALPVTVSPGQTARVRMHWHLVDCTRRLPPSEQAGGVEFTAHMANPPPGSAAASQRVFMAQLRPGLVRQMLLMACGQ